MLCRGLVSIRVDWPAIRLAVGNWRFGQAAAIGRLAAGMGAEACLADGHERRAADRALLLDALALGGKGAGHLTHGGGAELGLHEFDQGTGFRR
jgi:hypothetical protein